MSTKYAGIDYSAGQQVNRNKETGIRYGIIPANSIGQAWYDSAEPDYGDPHCPQCGNDVKPARGEYAKYDHAKHESADYVCHHCKAVFGGESAFSDESQGCTYEGDGITAFEDSQGDVWVTQSPYFTYAQFCSPCAPGACYLRNPLDAQDKPEANKCYCLPADWFDDESPCPYPVYSVATGELITLE